MNGGVSYYDAQMNDLGLVKKVAAEGAEKGVKIYENTPVTEFIIENGNIKGVKISTYATQKGSTNGINKPTELFIRAHNIVNVTGAWSNQLLEMDHLASKASIPPRACIFTCLKSVRIKRLFFTHHKTNACSLLCHRVFIGWYHGHTLLAIQVSAGN